MSGVAIKTENLTKRFKDVLAVDHVSIEVQQGEIFGLLGPNGAGKTTLIRMLCTLTKPTEGSAIVGGYDVVKDDAKVREHIGFVSEKMIMYAQLTARENLRLFGKLYNIPKGRLDTKINELLMMVDMEKWADKQIGKFSTGMKQRINVIRTLLHNPDILFLDEPTLGLDPLSAIEIREVIRKINADFKVTIILTTHLMVEADILSNRVGIIDDGKIAALDKSENLKKLITGKDIFVVELEISNLSHQMVSALESIPMVQSLMREDDTKVKVQAAGEDTFDEIIDTLRNTGGKIRHINYIDPTLEDVFLYITGHGVRDISPDTMYSKLRQPNTF